MNNKDLLRNFIEEVWNKNNPEVVDTYISSSFCVHLLGGKRDQIGVKGVKDNVVKSHKKFSELHIVIEDTVSEDDKIASRLTLHAVINGKEKTCREFMLHVVENGKFVEAWSLGSQWD